MSSPSSEATLSLAEVRKQIRALAIQRCDPSDPAHDELHLRRVVANGRAIVSALVSEGHEVDEFVVEAACWLHDIVQLPKGQGEPGEAARRSAADALALLNRLGVEPRTAEAVAGAIESHSFSGGQRPASLEAEVVQDADRLDALGAVGIARFWATMVRLGGSMYHPDDQAGLDRELDDRRWSLDHIERKLLRLVDLMNTDFGRAEAERRTAFLRAYRAEFLREIETPKG